MKEPQGIAGGIAAIFLNSKLTPLFIVASLALGTFACVNEDLNSFIVPERDSGLPQKQNAAIIARPHKYPCQTS